MHRSTVDNLLIHINILIDSKSGDELKKLFFARDRILNAVKAGNKDILENWLNERGRVPFSRLIDKINNSGSNYYRG
jgi:hypothetical protein